MSHPRFLADHDLNEHIIDGLLRREPSIEVVRSRDVQLSDRPDDEVLAYAAEHGLLLISHDVNTMVNAAKKRMTGGETVRGLLMVAQDASIASIIENLLLIWSASEANEWENQIRFLPL